MKKLCRVIVLASLLVIFSCNSGREKVLIEYVDGVAYIHNLQIPSDPDQKVKFQKDLTIGSTGADSVYVAKPLFFDVNKEGAIYILDADDQKIKVFDKEGGFLYEFGGGGQGPGEFMQCRRIHILPTGIIAAFDQSLRRFSFFDPKGVFIRSFKYNESLTKFIGASKNYLITWMNTLDSGDIDKIVYYSTDGGIISGGFDFKSRESVKVTLTMGDFVSSINRYFGYLPVPVFAFNKAENMLAHCRSDKYEISIYDTTGTIKRKIFRAYNAVPIREKYKKEYKRMIAGNNESIIAAVKKKGLPANNPIIKNMLYDDEGSLWVLIDELKEIDGVRVFRYDIYNRKGLFVASAWPSFRISLLKGGYAYAFKTDRETGVMVLNRYAVSD